MTYIDMNKTIWDMLKSDYPVKLNRIESKLDTIISLLEARKPEEKPAPTELRRKRISGAFILSLMDKRGPIDADQLVKLINDKGFFYRRATAAQTLAYLCSQGYIKRVGVGQYQLAIGS